MLKTGPCFYPPEWWHDLWHTVMCRVFRKSSESLDDAPHSKTSIYVMSALLKPRRASPQTTQGFSSNHAALLLKPPRASPQTTHRLSPRPPSDNATHTPGSRTAGDRTGGEYTGDAAGGEAVE